VIITAITPGPNTIMSMNNGAAHGFKKGIIFNFGIFTGFTVIMILCALFSTVLFSLAPKIALPMKIAGAIYMLYLAIKIFISHSDYSRKNAKGSFLAGFFLEFVNVKIMIYGITSFSNWIVPAYKHPFTLLLFAVFLSFAGFLCTLLWSAFGSLFAQLFIKHGKVLNTIMALLLVYCAVSLFL
jgi:threonine/homoserine/homoserine lactone efflux protein